MMMMMMMMMIRGTRGTRSGQGRRANVQENDLEIDKGLARLT